MQIDINQNRTMLGEGAAVRVSNGTATGAEGETHVYFESCEEAKTVTLSDTRLTDLGCTLDVAMTLRDICPGRRVAVGLSVSEVDTQGSEYPRGFRAVTVPFHTNGSACDIAMPVTRFVLPEDIRVCRDTAACTGMRHFVVRTVAHYIDRQPIA